MKDTQINGYADVNGKHVSNGKDTDTAGQDGVDAIQQAVGDLGRWQILVCIAISLIKFPVAWHQLAISFMAPEVHHECIYPARTNASDQCTVSLNGTHVECTKWEYDKSIFSETIVSQWNLVCDDRRYKDWLQSTLMFGILLGNIVFGSMADRYGRKLPLIICIFLQLASGIGCAIIPWFPALFVMKLLSAMATGGTMVTSFVICMEIVGAQWRAAITVLYQIPYSLGHMSLAGLAYLFRHWQHLQFAITLPSIVLLSYWWIIPESPRWLLAVGKQKAACKVLKKGARINKINDKDIPELVRKHCLHQNTKRTPSDHNASFFDLFRTPNMRIKTLAIFFNWIVCGMGLFGLSQYVSQLAGDMFLNFALSGIIQVPGNFISWWVMNAFGRKITLIVSNVVSGICCLLYFLVPNELAWLKLILICLGVAGMSISFTTVYLFSGELFPTVVRNIGVGASSMCARLGSITAPHVVALSIIQPALPPVLIGLLALVGAVLCLYLPETAGCTLPETLQDGEDFGKKIKKNKKDQKDLEAEIAL